MPDLTPDSTADPLLTIRDLSIERGERLILDGFDFQISSGEIVLIAGPNGAGKTSLMRTIVGLLEPAESCFKWKGIQVSNANRFSDEILYLGHKPAVRHQLTPLENLQWFAQLHSQQVKTHSDSDLMEALAILGLAGYENDLCSTLSAGQKRRVGLARMALSNAPLWVLDEPFTAVDIDGVRTLLNWVEDYASSGGAILYTTHQKVEFRKRHPRTIDLSANRSSAASYSGGF